MKISVLFILIFMGCGDTSEPKAPEASVELFVEKLEKSGMKVNVSKGGNLFASLKKIEGHIVQADQIEFEVYKFDPTNPESFGQLKILKERGFFGKPVLIADNLVILKEPKRWEWGKIKAIFRELDPLPKKKVDLARDPEFLKYQKELIAQYRNMKKEVHRDAQDFYEEGVDLYIMGKRTESIALLNKALNVEPDYLSAHFFISLMYDMDRNGGKAIAHMLKAEKLFHKKQDKVWERNAKEKLREYHSKYKRGTDF